MAQTPWGNLPVADAHVHFFSHRFYSSLAAQKKLADAAALGPLLEWEIPGSDAVALAKRWVAELDRCGVSRAALIASIPEDESSVEAAVAAYPDRFFGFFMVDPLRPGAHERVRAVLERKRLHCLCLFPAMHGYSITDPRIVPTLEAAADQRAIVFVHCGTLSVGIRKKLGLASPFDMRYSNPIDLHPVALHFPQIRFIVPHFGAGYFREALMLADLVPNVYLDSSSTNRWMAYDPSGLDLRTVFRRSIELLGHKRLLFGTDSSFFPRGWHATVFEQQVKVLYELGLDESEARLILHDNLTALFQAATD
jgi:predicted TIM-barrel fold metal-dependent hydrolase